MGQQKELDTPYDVSGTIRGQEVDSFAFNIADNLIHIGYTLLETPIIKNQTDKPHTLTGQEYIDFQARLEELAPGAAQALIRTCLEFLPGSGSIS